MEILQHIDAICRQVRRDVLYAEFHPESRDQLRRYHFDLDDQRAALLRQLDQLAIGYWPCGPLANPLRLDSYRGQIYLDVPAEQQRPAFLAVCKLFCVADHAMLPNVRLYRLTLDTAMQNAEHDEPGFWDRWAANF